MVGAELVVGYLFAWVMRKARRAGERADSQVDVAVDAGVDRLGAKLHDLVAGKLPGDRALELLEQEAREGRTEPSERAGKSVTWALEDAVKQDLVFARALEQVVAQLQAAQAAAGGVVAGAGGLASSGSLEVHAEGGSIAAGVFNAGSLTLGNPPLPGPPQS